MFIRRRTEILAGFAVAFVALAASANTLSGGFVYDDIDNVLRNPWIREPGRLLEAFTHHMAAFSPGYDTSYYRPLMHVIFAGAESLFGLNAWGYHLILLLLHVAASVVVFVLLVRFTDGRAKGAATPGQPQGAFIGAILFAVHPIHVEAVAWISGVVDLSYSLSALLTLLALTSASPWRRLLLAPAMFFVALLGKEPAVMLIPIFVILAVARGDLKERNGQRRFAATAAGLGVALTVYLVLRVTALGGLMGTGGARRVTVGIWDGLLTAVALFGKYAGLLLFPINQTALYDFPVVTELADPRVWTGIAAVVAVVILAWQLRGNPGAVLGIALLALPLLPALYVPVLGDGLVAERYLYLPSAGLALLTALAWNAWVRRRPAWFRARAAVAAVLVIVGGVATFSRNRVWHDELALWTDAARKSPRSAAVHGYLGFALYTAGQPDAAVASLSRAIELDPDKLDAHVNLAAALLTSGRVDEALIDLDRILSAHPGIAEANGLLGYALTAKGRLPEAVVAFRRALELDPRLAASHNGLGIVLAQLGDIVSAAAEFKEAIRLDPGNPSYSKNLGSLGSGQPAPVR